MLGTDDLPVDLNEENIEEKEQDFQDLTFSDACGVDDIEDIIPDLLKHQLDKKK